MAWYDFLTDIGGTGYNIFGAAPSENTKIMQKMGLLGDDAVKKAQQKSLLQGLLTTGLSYAAQPKTGGYGSAIPYLAKAGLAGVQAAQSPYDQLTQDAMMNQQLQEIQRVQTDETMTDKAFAQLISSTPELQGQGYENLPASQKAELLKQYTGSKFKSMFDKTSNTYKPAPIKSKEYIDPETKQVMEQELTLDVEKSKKENKEIWVATGEPIPKYKPDTPLNMDYINQRAMAVARGDMKPPTGREMRSPEGQAIIAKVLEINPNWSQMTYDVTKSSLTQLDRQQNMVGAFEKTALKNLDVALEYGMKVNNTQVPVFNRWKNAGMKSIAGDADVAAFNAATETFANEFAKIMSGATGAAAATEGARAEAQSLLNSAMSWDQFKEVANVMRRDMTNRMQSFEEQKFELKTSLRALEDITGGVPKTLKSKDVPTVGTVSEGYIFKGGDPSNSNNWEKI